jgi:hypothetical protein
MLHAYWTKHLKTPEERTKFEEAVRADVYVLSRLDAILDEMASEIEREELSVTQFERPNWEYQTAYRFGDKARLAKLKALTAHLKE